METAHGILLTLHIIFGSLSLIVFWLPVIVKKGGDTHIKIGKIYVALMWLVVISAVLLSMMNLYQAMYIKAAFLGYLAVITAHPLWYGIAILKYKIEMPKGPKRINLIFNWTLFIGGIGLLIWSLLLKVQGPAILLLIFGSLGTISSIPLIFPKKNKVSNPIGDHIQGMVATGIAAYTAFFAFGGATFLGHIFKGPLFAVPWILPTLIGTVLIMKYKRKYTPQKNHKTQLTTKKLAA